MPGGVGGLRDGSVVLMSERIRSIIEGMPEFRKVEDVRLFADLIRDIYDVDHVVYVVVSFGGAPNFGDYQFGEITYRAEWSQHYLEESYKEVDPTAIGAVQSFTPLDWKRLDWGPRKRRKLILEAVDAGVGNQGYTVPIRGPNGQFAVLTVNKTCTDRVWEQYIAETASDWLLVANFIHQKVLEIFKVKCGDEFITLSPRERDALAMISSGLSRTETAEKLKISENTLRVYLDSARNKLGGLNMPHAVALAVRSGIIDM